MFANAGYLDNVTQSGLIQPAFDWLTHEEIVSTNDRILQESVVCYKPAFQVIVFVFLLSKTGRSMAIWRRKLPVPDTLRIANRDAIVHALEGLSQERLVYVDE